MADEADEKVATTAVPTPAADSVAVGCRVWVRDAEGDHEHVIVTRLTANAPLTWVSVASPVGRALLGHKVGERVEVQTPDGIRLLTIVGVTIDAPPSSCGNPLGCGG